MFWRSKSINRRLARDRVLDVKLRSSQVRAARTRMVGIALGVVLATVFGVYLLWQAGAWGLNQLIYENRAFAIQEIDVQTEGVIAVDQLRRWTGVKPGQNLLALDLARVKRDLELVPLIQSVSVERILPHTLRIRVVEREPIAQASVPRPRASGGVELAVYQVDADGYVIVPLEARQRALPAAQPDDQLPVICGLNTAEVLPGRRIPSPQVQAALQLLLAFQQSPMNGRVDLKRIDVSQSEVLTITTGQGSEVTFGLQDLEQQIRRWHMIFQEGLKMNRAIASLDLAITNNIPARWLEASAVLPSGPVKMLKPLRNKKKHV